MKRLVHNAAPVLVLLVVWTVAGRLFGSQVVPGPLRTVVELAAMTSDGEMWRHLCLTVFRGLSGLLLATLAAYALGLPCGLSPAAMTVMSPLVTAMQSCPPIIWISLLLVWVSVGGGVPVLVVFAAVFPMLFLNVAQGVASLDRGLFVMAKVYHIPNRRVILDIILPGISRYALAAFSFALGVTWKVAATAEFFGAGDGVGARIYWSYRLLDMPRLFAWTVVLIVVGMSLELGIIHPLRERLQEENQPAGRATR